jgi:hypothetical protein
MQKYKTEDVPEYFTRMYQRKNQVWVLAGYKCPDCGVLYKGLRAELFRHSNNCKGAPRRSLEE